MSQNYQLDEDEEMVEHADANFEEIAFEEADMVPCVCVCVCVC
jgi:hypothetical protein